MPNFPIYRGEQPEVLNPLNLRHYLLLAYWVYFRPTALNCYLHAAMPNLEKVQGLGRIFRLWRVRAYRNVYLMLPIALFIFALLVGSVVSLYTLTTFQGNPSWVNAIAVTPNGQLAVSATGTRDLTIQVPSVDSTLKVWNLRWGTQMHTLRGHSYGVTAVAITPDGKQAVSAARDHSLKVWDLKSGKQLHNLKGPKGHTQWVTSVAITSDGKRAVSTSADKTLKVWDLKSGKVLHTLTGHTDTVGAVALTPDGQRAVSASADQTLKVWDIVHGEELYTLKGHNAWVTGVAITSDGQQAVSASVDQTLHVWDIAHGKSLYTLKGHQGWVTAIALTPDGKAVSASSDQTLKVWDIGQGKELKTLTGHQGWVTSLTITPDGHQAVSASSDQTVKVWDLDKLKILHTLSGHNAWVTAIAVTSNTPRVISASFKDYPKVWDLKSGSLLPMRGVVAQSIGINVGLWTVLPFAILSTAISIAVILAVGVMTFGVLGGIVSSFVPVGVISLVFCISFVMLARIAADPILNEQYRLGNTNTLLSIIFGILLGLLVGVTFALISRPATGVFGAIAFTLLLGAAVALVVICVISPAITLKGRIRPGITAFQTVGITFNYLVAFGAFRLLFYPIQLVLAFLSRFRGKLHPVLWDELLVLPVPGTRALLQARLATNSQSGLLGVAEVLRNPFQRVFAQQALQNHLHSSATPLDFLYSLLTNPDLNTYLVAPIARRDWQLLPATRQVLLGELANQKVDCTSDGINYLAENLVWSVTRFGRNGKVTNLTRFAEFLYQLAYTKVVETEDFKLSDYQKVYAGLTEYPGGSEIAESFEATAIFLTYEQLSDLSGASNVVKNLAMIESPLRPSVLTALTRLGEIASSAIIYDSVTSTVEKLAVIAQITRHLDRIDDYVLSQIMTPEQAILRRIIAQWRRIVSQTVVESED